MEVVKWIVFVVIIGITIYLIIDTTIWARKKIKEKKKRELEKKQDVIDNNDSK